MIQFILFLSFIIRLVSLDQSFWLDEATSATVAGLSIPQILQFSRGDFHPPLYYIFLHYWTTIFGTSEVNIRMLSVLFGVGTVYLVYKIASHVLNRQQVLVASVLTAFSPLLVYYSQEARMYSQLGFFAALSIYFYIKNKWAALAIAFVLLVATDYMGVLMIPVFLVDSILRRKNLKKMLFSLLPLGIATIVWWSLFSQQLASGLEVRNTNSAWWSILGGNSIKQIFLFVVKVISGRIGFDSTILYASAVSVPSLISGYFLFKGLKKKKLAVIWSWLAIPTVLGLLVSFVIPIFSYFRFLFVIPALCILIGAGFNRKVMKEKILLGVFVVFQIIFIILYLFSPVNHREDWRGLVKFISDREPNGTIVYFVANSQMEAFRWYTTKLDSKITAIAASELEATRPSLWVMRYVHDIFDPQDLTLRRVNDLGYTVFDEYNFRGVVVRHYTK